MSHCITNHSIQKWLSHCTVLSVLLMVSYKMFQIWKCQCLEHLIFSQLWDFSSHSDPQNVPDMEISVPFFSNSGTIILAAIIIVIIEMVLTTDFPPLRLVRRNLKILDPKSPRAKLGTICSSFWDVPRQKWSWNILVMSPTTTLNSLPLRRYCSKWDKNLASIHKWSRVPVPGSWVFHISWVMTKH